MRVVLLLLGVSMFSGVACADIFDLLSNMAAKPTPLPKTFLSDGDEYKDSLGQKFRLMKTGEFYLGACRVPDSEKSKTLKEYEKAKVFDSSTPKPEFVCENGAHDDISAQEDELPRKKMLVDAPYYIGEYEVTFGQFKGFAKENFESISPKFAKCNTGKTDNMPVTGISSDDAMNYIHWLNKRRSQDMGDWYYSLPTTAQWEYAARGGTVERYYWGTSEKEIGKYANVGSYRLSGAGVGDFSSLSPQITESVQPAPLEPVGKRKPNPAGLYDVLGNAGEWVYQWYYPALYQNSGLTKASQSRSRLFKEPKLYEVRGGGSNQGFRENRITSRFGVEGAGCYIGFRLSIEYFPK